MSGWDYLFLGGLACAVVLAQTFVNLRVRQRNTGLDSAAALFELAVFSALPDAILVVETSGNIAYANARASDLTGWTYDELVGQTVDRLVPEDVRSVHANYRRLFVNDPSARRMAPGRPLLKLRHRDGTLIPVDIALNSIPTAAGRLTVAQVRDMRGVDSHVGNP